MGTQNPAHLRLTDLTKVYDGSVRAVDGVELAVKQGEFVTLVGPSGCGKSTTLRMLAGFVEPTEGVIEMDFTDITDASPDNRDVGMVFQSIALFPHMTVKENIAYGMRVSDESFSESEVDERVEEMLELIEMPGYQERYPEQLSGGQSQRVGLARALALKPEVLLLDEPLSALDEKLRDHMQTELTRIQRELGVTTVFVTHNQEEAMTMSDRIVVMNDGEFEQIGSPEEVYNEPKTEFVGDFMGQSNIFSGQVSQRTGDQATIDTDLGTLTVPAETVDHGGDVRVLVRPENFQITGGTEATGEITATGTINLVQLIGAEVRYELETDAGDQITVSQQSDGTVSFERGDRVTVSFESSAARVFTEDEERATDSAGEEMEVAS